jgi:hypothetical protein
MQLHDLQISLGCDRGAETRKDEQPPRILEPTRGLEKPSAKPALGQAGQVCVEELSKEADGRIACNGIRRCGGPVWHVRRHQQLSRPGPKRFQIWGFELVWTKGRQRFLSRAVPGLHLLGDRLGPFPSMACLNAPRLGPLMSWRFGSFFGTI